jgi:hypothetical protein
MSTAPVSSVTEQNKHMILRWFEEVWNQSRREVIHELLDPCCEIHDGPITIKGPAEFDGFYDALHAHFSDFRVTPDVLVAENDLVCLRWTCTSRHKVSEKATTVTGTSIVRVRDGRFVEAWQNWDAARLAEQIPDIPLANFL